MDSISTSRFNLLGIIGILGVSLLAWIAKDEMEKHMAVSAFGVLVLCFLSNASVLLPSSSILIVIECSLLINPFLVAICGAFGAALGEMTGFYLGSCGKKAMSGRFRKMVKPRMENHKYLIVLLFSALPLPIFDVVGMLSGAMNMSALKFFGLCFTGKLLKMLSCIWLTHGLLALGG